MRKSDQYCIYIHRTGRWNEIKMNLCWEKVIIGSSKSTQINLRKAFICRQRRFYYSKDWKKTKSFACFTPGILGLWIFPHFQVLEWNQYESSKSTQINVRTLFISCQGRLYDSRAWKKAKSFVCFRSGILELLNIPAFPSFRVKSWIIKKHSKERKGLSDLDPHFQAKKSKCMQHLGRRHKYNKMKAFQNQ